MKNKVSIESIKTISTVGTYSENSTKIWPLNHNSHERQTGRSNKFKGSFL